MFTVESTPLLREGTIAYRGDYIPLYKQGVWRLLYEQNRG